MMDCKKIHPLLSLYREDRLPVRSKTQVEAHLKLCAEARKTLEQFGKLDKALKDLPDPKIPNDLHERIMGRLREEKTVLRPKVSWLKPAWSLAVAAALTFFFIFQWVDRENPWKGPTLNNTQDKVSALKQAASLKPMNKPVPAPARVSGGVAYKAKEEEKDTAHYTQSLANESSNGSDLKTALGPSTNAETSVQENAKNFAVSDLQVKRKKMASTRSVESEKAPSSNLSFQDGSTEKPMAFGAAAPAMPMAEMQPAATLPPRIYQGDNAPATVESAQLITDLGSFTKIWQFLKPSQALPIVDFANESVVFLEAGEKPTGGYSINISGLVDQTDLLVIHYLVSVPPTGAVVTQTLTHPWSLQIISTPNKPVTFLKDP